MIRTEGLTKRYGESTAVDSVTVVVPDGSVVGLLGPTGAGKTTLLRLLLGIVHPSRGSGRVLGCDLLAESAEIRRRVAFVPEAKTLYPGVPVADFLALYASFHPDMDARSAIVRLDRWGVDVERSGQKLSRGGRAKVLLAAALARRAELFLFDEPSEGLDPGAVEDLWTSLMSRVGAAEGVGLVLASHRIEEIERVCDRVVVLKHGRVVLEGELDALRERWRRVILRGSGKDWRAESVPGAVAVRDRGGLIELTTAEWDAALVRRLPAEVVDAHAMTLREIYLTVVGLEGVRDED